MRRRFVGRLHLAISWIFHKVAIRDWIWGLNHSEVWQASIWMWDHFLVQCITNMHSGVSKACQVLCGHKKTDNISFVWECSLIFIHMHFRIFVYAHSIIHNPRYLIGNSVADTPHTFWNLVLSDCRWWEVMVNAKLENASLKWWDTEDRSLLYMMGSNAHLLCSKMPIHSSNLYWNSCKQCKK
jgi:hypothetical protein